MERDAIRLRLVVLGVGAALFTAEDIANVGVPLLAEPQL